MSPGQRPHKPEEIGPRIYRRGRWFAVDLRPWGMGRPTMRNPKHPAWPERGGRTPLREVAERWRLDYWDLARGEHRRTVLGGGGSPMKLGEAVSTYLDHRRAVKQHSTWVGDRTATGHLLDALGPEIATASITTRQIQAWATSFLERGYKPSTVRQYLRSMSTFFGWLGSHDPTEGVELADPGADDVVPWSDPELIRLREAARNLGHILPLEIGLSMGLRKGEIFALRWEDFRPDTRTVRVRRQVEKDTGRVKGLKGKRAGTTLVLPPWWRHHRPGIGYITGSDGQPLSDYHQTRIIGEILDRAGLNAVGVGWHRARHTYARLFLEGGGWMDELQRSLRHASIQTTESIYGHLRPDRAAERAGARIYG